MPRSGSDMDGYESMHVCGFCIEFLTSTSSALSLPKSFLIHLGSVTASGRNALKALSLGKLKKYATSYGIGIDRAVEKDDIIDAIVAARVSHFFELIS